MEDLPPSTARYPVDPASLYGLEGPATVRLETPPPTLRETPASKVDHFTTRPPPCPFPAPDTTATKLRRLATSMWGPSSSLPDSKQGAVTSVPPSAPLPPTKR
jgi:hypothetical protein